MADRGAFTVINPTWSANRLRKAGALAHGDFSNGVLLGEF